MSTFSFIKIRGYFLNFKKILLTPHEKILIIKNKIFKLKNYSIPRKN
jgi:hypothetical protein